MTILMSSVFPKNPSDPQPLVLSGQSSPVSRAAERVFFSEEAPNPTTFSEFNKAYRTTHQKMCQAQDKLRGLEAELGTVERVLYEIDQVRVRVFQNVEGCDMALCFFGELQNNPYNLQDAKILIVDFSQRRAWREKELTRLTESHEENASLKENLLTLITQEKSHQLNLSNQLDVLGEAARVHFRSLTGQMDALSL